MKRKRFTVALVAFLLAGCGSVQQGEIATTARQPQTHATTQPLPKFRQTTLVDSKSCLFRVEDVDPGEKADYTVKVHLENRTDQDLMFSWNEVSVNGYMCDPFWAISLPPGTKVKDEIVFPHAQLKESDIREVTEISFALAVYDAENWSAPRLVDEVFTLYPQGQAGIREYPRSPQKGDIVLFDTEDCAMTVAGFDPENPWGYTVRVYLHNRTDDTLMFSVGDATVNGYLCDPYWALAVAPGKRSYSAISWLPDDFAIAGIRQVESISLPVRVYEADEATDKPVIEETFLLQPPR